MQSLTIQFKGLQIAIVQHYIDAPEVIVASFSEARTQNRNLWEFSKTEASIKCYFFRHAALPTQEFLKL